MEYVRERGCFLDVPVAEIKRVFSEIYPRYHNLGPEAAKPSFC